LHKRPIWQAALIFSPFLIIEGAFLAANLLKVMHGGYVPLAIAGGLILIMWTWTRGLERLAKAAESDLSITDVMTMLAARPPMRARGTAVFLTQHPDRVPVSLMHNLKHNQVLHEQVVLLTVKVVRRPRVPDAERVEVKDLGPGFKALSLSFGFMERPNVALGLSLARAKGLKFDIMRTSFFVSRRTLLPRPSVGPGHLQDLLFVFLMRNAQRAADFFQIPPSRVVELGAQVAF
jgi:KUP system potassium uptake protein